MGLRITNLVHTSGMSDIKLRLKITESALGSKQSFAAQYVSVRKADKAAMHHAPYAQSKRPKPRQFVFPNLSISHVTHKDEHRDRLL